MHKHPVSSVLATLCALVFFSSPAAGQTITNPSFEADAVPPPPGYGPVTGWTGATGLNNSAGPFADNGAIADGEKVAFIVTKGTMSQTVSGFVVGAQYRLRYYENARVCCAPRAANLQVTVGGVTVVPTHSVVSAGGSNPYVQKTSDLFMANASSLEVAFITSGSGDFTVLLDKVELISVPSSVVTKTADTNDGTCDADCSLREAITAANANPGPDTITFNLPGDGPHTIQLTGVLPDLQSGDIANTSGEGVTVRGEGAADPYRIFRINFGNTVNLSGLTITNGNPGNAQGGGIYNDGTLGVTNSTVSGNSSAQGGGIYNGVGTVTVTNSIVSGNSTSGPGSPDGGGIYSNGTVSVTNSTVSGNSAGAPTNFSGAGGGIYNRSATLNVTNSTISGNSARVSGGGIENRASLSVVNSTISGNSANSYGGGIGSLGTLTLTGSTVSGNTVTANGGQGGGILNDFGGLTVTNSTISGNSAGRDGGGISTNGSTTLTSTTVTNNRAANSFVNAGTGGGIFIKSGTPLLRSSIVAGNSKEQGEVDPVDDIANGSLNSTSSYNLIGTGGAGGLINGTNNNQVGVANAFLAALANNGGPTPTHALLGCSRAVDNGKNFDLTTDQRGLPRPFDNPYITPVTSGGDNSDIGAVESQEPVVCPEAFASPNPATTNEDTAIQISLFGTHAENRPLTFAITAQPTHGTLVTNLSRPGSADGDIASAIYTPNADYNGTDSFKFKANDGISDSAEVTVSIIVNAVNDAPTASAAPNVAAPVNKDTPVQITLRGTDAEDSDLTFSITQQPSNGTLSSVPAPNCSAVNTCTAAVTYTPNANYSGTDSFKFKVNDGTFDSSEATVQIIVPCTTFSNPDPITIPAGGTSSPYPSTITVAGLGGTVSHVAVTLTNVSHTFPSDVDVLLVGPGGERLLLMSDVSRSEMFNQTYTFYDAAATTLAATGDNFSGSYRPTNFGGGDTFPAPAPAGPYADPQLLSVFNETAPNGTWSLYVVDAFNGDAGSINGGWSLSILTTNCVAPSNTAPTASAAPNPATTNEDAATTIALTGTDADDNNLTFTVTQQPTNGTLGAISAADCTAASTCTATVTYTPNANYNGGDSFKFKVNDGTVDSAEVTVNITVTAANDAPTITAQASVSRQQASPLANGQIATVNDVEETEDTLVVRVGGGASQTVNGVTVSNLAINASGLVTADVVASCTATNASFTLRVTDNASAFNEATLAVAVTANTATSLGNYAATAVSFGSSGSTVTPDAAPVDNGSVQSVTATAPNFTGMFAVNTATGVITVNNAGPAGSHTVTVTATDNCALTSTKQFTLTVNQPAAITSASSATFTVGTDGSFTVTTSGSPTPAITSGGDALPFNLTFVDNGDGTGTLSGMPAAGTGGVYNITFTASGGGGTQNFTLTVNEAPTITSANSTSFTEGNTGSFSVTANGFPTPTYSASGALPSGVTFVNGLLSGTPASGTVGNYSLQITAANGIGSNDVESFTLTVVAPVCVAPPVDLVAWYPAEGNAVDVESGNNGTALNGAGYANAKVAQGFTFNGSTAVVEVPDSAAWDFASNTFTVQTWVNFAALSGTDVLVGHSEGSGSVNKWLFWLKSGKLEFHLNGSAVSNITSGANFAPVLGRWYHVAVTRSGNTYKFYVDGVQNGIDRFDSNTVPTANAPLSLGKAEVLAAMNGSLDEVQIFSRALTPAEIQSVYNASTEGFCVDAPAVVSAASRKTHGPAGAFDLNLPLTGAPAVECRSAGANGDHTIVVSFNNTVTEGNAAVSSGNVSGTPMFSGNTMTLNLTGVPNAQQITISLTNVKDGFAQVLPNASISMNVLLGDTTGNKAVTASDVGQVKAASGQPISPANFRMDVSLNGVLNGSDLSMTKAAAGTFIP